MSKVTVLMPVYNGARYLQESVRSILTQSFGDFEFLIIDDGSTDDSSAIIERFGDSRIRLLRNRNRLKLSGALNRGIAEAAGHYIARMDADDVALPHRLKKQVAMLDARPDIGICGSWIKKIGMRSEINRFPESLDDIKAYALFDCPFAHPTVMFRKSFFDQYGLRYNGDFYPTEDFELWGRAIALFPCVNIGEVLLKYRVHDSSMTTSDWDHMDEQATRVIQKQLDRLHIGYTRNDLIFHRNIGRGASSRAGDLFQLDRARRWLDKLLAANRRQKCFNEAALAKTAALVWYRFCLNSSALGMGVLGRYLASPISRRAVPWVSRTAVLAASVAKNRTFAVKKY